MGERAPVNERESPRTTKLYDRTGDEIGWFRLMFISLIQQSNRTESRLHLSWIILILWAGFVVGESRGNEIISIGSRRELFVDKFLVDRIEGGQLRLHPPVSAGTVLRFDQPWEGALNGYFSVFKDGETYRMYYRGYNPRAEHNYVCYAESKDGSHWERPALGLLEINGSRANNAVFTPDSEEDMGGNAAVFLDRRPGVPANERIKLVVSTQLGRALVCYVSQDGKRFRRLKPEPLYTSDLPYAHDSMTCVFWSVSENCYVSYFRHTHGGRRAVARTTSSDFVEWTSEVAMKYSDTGTSTPSQHLYTNQTHPYFRAPHIYIALPARYFPGRRVLTDKQVSEIQLEKVNWRGGVSTWSKKDVSDVGFMTTRGGNRYDRVFMEAFIRPGQGLRHWTSRSNYAALGVVPTGDHQMSIYVNRHYGQETAYLERLTLRLDGFASLHAPYSGGELTTKPLTYQGDRLVVNLSTSAAGSLRVELQNPNGEPIPGFTLSECIEIIGDEIDRTVSWRQGADVSGWAGKPLRIRFYLKDADLFSFQFREQ